MGERYVECSKCREQVVWRENPLLGRNQWIHLRTAAHVCKPACSTCGKPATHRVGAVTPAGDGTLTFRTQKYVCDDCDRDSLRITYE